MSGKIFVVLMERKVPYTSVLNFYCEAAVILSSKLFFLLHTVTAYVHEVFQ